MRTTCLVHIFLIIIIYLFFMARLPQVGQGLLIFGDPRLHSYKHTTLGRTALDERSARCRDLYLTTHNTYNRQTSTNRRDSKTQSQQATNTLESTATGIACYSDISHFIIIEKIFSFICLLLLQSNGMMITQCVQLLLCNKQPLLYAKQNTKYDI
jgi:hypothetical protein